MSERINLVQNPPESERLAVSPASVVAAVLTLVGLYFCSRYSYLLFHLIAEGFSIVVACAIFLLVWNARDFLQNGTLQFIGAAYLFVGALDFLHAAAYQGMDVFPGYGANHATELWIAARYLESVAMFAAPWFAARKLDLRMVLAGFGAVFVVLAGSIFIGIFPTCFVEGVGLTPFKVVSEYAIALILLASIGHFLRKRALFDRDVLRLFVASLAVTIASELAFAFYRDVFGILNLIGHYLKIVAFYLVYKAVIHTGLSRPYALLFRELDQRRRQLHDINDRLEETVAERTAKLSSVTERLRKELSDRTRTERRLAESETRLRAIFDRAPIGMGLSDMAGSIVDSNPALQAMFGYSKDEIRGKSFLDFVHADDPPPTRSVIRELLVRKQGPFDEERRCVRKDGTTLWCRVRVSLIEASEAGPAYFLGMLVDISARKRMEKTLLAIARQRAAVAELGTRVLSGGNAAAALDDVVAVVARVLGADVCAILELLPDRPSFLLRAGVGFREGLIGTAEVPLVANTLAGYTVSVDNAVVVSDFPAETRFPRSWLLSEHGAVSGVSVVIAGSEAKPFGVLEVFHCRPQDFSTDDVDFVQSVGHVVAGAVARLQAHEALAVSERHFRILVEHLPIGVLIVQDGRVVFRNSEQRRAFGTEAGPLDTMLRGKVFREDAKKYRRLREAILAGAPIEVDLRFSEVDAEGRPEMKWALCRTRAIEYGGGQATLVDMTDITRAKELEQIAIVREKLASLGQLSAGIAHEIRNPLSGINIYVSALEHVARHAEDLGEEEREKLFSIVEKIGSASTNIASVVQRIMEFSKPTPPKPDLIDVNRAVREAVQLSSTMLRKHEIHLAVSLHPDPPLCNADPRLLAQVLLNLITNAVQAMAERKEGKELEISTNVVEGRIVIRVADSGPGVPAPIRLKIFDPFYTTRKAGHGIGLSFCHRVVADHGGTLRVEESRWGGAEFVITLPLEDERTPT